MSQASAGVGGSHQEIVTLFRTIICQMRNAEESPPVIIFIKLGYSNDLGLNADLRSKAVLGMNPAGMAYVPTEEERRVFRECNQESFWYRSLPFSAMGMLVTQGLISRGIFTSSSRFGSIPKVAFAGVCGYLAGKMSYMKTCQEKFKKLENSPLGEALRQGHRTFPPQFAPEKSEFSDAEKPDYQSSFQSVLQPPPTSSSYSDDFSYTDRSLSTYEPAQFGSSPSGAEDLSPQAPGLQIEDETPKKAPIMYEELRNKNRENYEVTMTQKAEVLLKPQQDRAPKTEVKKNMYGDTWDE